MTTVSMGYNERRGLYEVRIADRRSRFYATWREAARLFDRLTPARAAS